MDQPPRSTKGLSWYALIVRIVLGVVFISHGYQKLFADMQAEGLNDQQLTKLVEMNLIPKDAPDKQQAVTDAKLPALYNIAFALEFSGNLNAVAENSESAKQLVNSIKSYAKPLSWAAALTEFLGGCCMILGLLTRIWALGLVGTMVTAAFLVHWNSAGMNILDPAWQVGKGGVEYTFVLGLLSLGVFFGGPGKVSLDRLMFRRRKYEPIPVQQKAQPKNNPNKNAPGTPGESAGSPPRVVSQNLPGTPISTSQRPTPAHQPSPISPSNANIQSNPGNPGTNSGNPGANSGSNPAAGNSGANTGSNSGNKTSGNPDGKGKGTGSYGIRRPSRSEEEPPTRPI